VTDEAASARKPTQDERVTADLAHATAILPVMGVLAGVVIWATQKEKSRYVAFHALQATVYHIVMILASFLAGICYMCSIFAFPLTLPFSVSTSDSTTGDVSPLFFLPMLIPFTVIGLAGLLWLGFVVYGLVGAANSLQGKDFRYLVIGKRLERYLAAG